MIALYIVCIILSLLLCFWYFLADVRRSIVQNLLLISIVVSNVGYYALAMQPETTGAILACKIYYIGACFVSFLFFLTACEVCKIKLPRVAICAMVVFLCAVVSSICTIGHGRLYYETVELTQIDGVGVLEKTYGPLHVLYPILLYGFMISSVIFTFISFIKRKNVYKPGMLIMLFCELIGVASYAVQRFCGVVFDFTPAIYIVISTGAFVYVYKSDIYDVADNSEVIHEQLSRVGFISFTKKMKYMGANDFTKNLFPELISCNLGYEIQNPTAELKTVIEEIRDFFEKCRADKKLEDNDLSRIRVNERIYETKVHVLRSFTRRCVGATLEIRDITEQTRVLELTERYNEELSAEVARKTEQIRDIQTRTILGMAQMVESRDLSTGGHIKRTSDVVRIFAKKLLESDMGFDAHFLDLVVRSAPMHDLGKIGVDDQILRKQGKFTDEEFAQMKRHSEVGGKMVRDILTGVEEDDFVEVAFNVANYHHEKVSGKGYPCGLKGDEIPVEAKIMALADVFDALVSKRCYKDAFTYDKAFSIIEEDTGFHFDEKLAPVFISCREELEAYYNSSDH